MGRFFLIAASQLISLALFISSYAFAISSVPQLPPLEESALAAFLPEVRQQILDAYRDAQKNQHNPQRSGRLGMVFHAYDEFELAMACYLRAQALDPSAFEWFYYCGLAQLKLGAHEKAIEVLRKAVELNPRYLPARLYLAQAYYSARRMQDSKTLYQELLEDHPNLVWVHYGLGKVRSALAEIGEALRSFQKTCELAPEFGAAHYALALTYRDLKQPEKAKEHFAIYQRNLGSKPALADPLFERVGALRRGAVHHFESAQELEAQGRLKEAALQYEKALKLKSDLSQAHSNLISVYGKLGQHAMAEEHYQAGLKMNSDLPELHYNYGVFLGLQGRFEEASRSFQRAVDINPHYSDAHNNLGQMREQSGRIADAEKHYRMALAADPKHSLAHFNLARILAHRGRYAEAIQHLLQTLEPENERTPVFMYALADAYARAGEIEKAIHYAQEAIHRAAARGQKELAAIIEEDLRRLRNRIR